MATGALQAEKRELEWALTDARASYAPRPSAYSSEPAHPAAATVPLDGYVPAFPSGPGGGWMGSGSRFSSSPYGRSRAPEFAHEVGGRTAGGVVRLTSGAKRPADCAQSTEAATPQTPTPMSASPLRSHEEAYHVAGIAEGITTAGRWHAARAEALDEGAEDAAERAAEEGVTERGRG